MTNPRLISRDGSQVILAGALGPDYLRQAARAAEEFEREMHRIQVTAAATDEMIRNRFEPILARLALSIQRSQRRRDQAAARERKRRHQRTGRGYR